MLYVILNLTLVFVVGWLVYRRTRRAADNEMMALNERLISHQSELTELKKDNQALTQQCADLSYQLRRKEQDYEALKNRQH